MTLTPRTLFVEGRTRAQQERTEQQQLAVPLSTRLGVYVRRVATAVGVPDEATGHEVTDTATAYIALDQRSATHPDHDLMLVWDERLGWYIAVETTPTEPPEVVAYLKAAAVPAPATVARFVADTVSGRQTCRIRPVLSRAERTTLAEDMATVC